MCRLEQSRATGLGVGPSWSTFPCDPLWEGLTWDGENQKHCCGIAWDDATSSLCWQPLVLLAWMGQLAYEHSEQQKRRSLRHTASWELAGQPQWGAHVGCFLSECQSVVGHIRKTSTIINVTHVTGLQVTASKGRCWHQGRPCPVKHSSCNITSQESQTTRQGYTRSRNRTSQRDFFFNLSVLTKTPRWIFLPAFCHKMHSSCVACLMHLNNIWIFVEWKCTRTSEGPLTD